MKLRHVYTHCQNFKFSVQAFPKSGGLEPGARLCVARGGGTESSPRGTWLACNRFLGVGFEGWRLAATDAV